LTRCYTKDNAMLEAIVAMAVAYWLTTLLAGFIGLWWR